jgi:hypothetical protein
MMYEEMRSSNHVSTGVGACIFSIGLCFDLDDFAFPLDLGFVWGEVFNEDVLGLGPDSLE